MDPMKSLSSEMARNRPPLGIRPRYSSADVIQTNSSYLRKLNMVGSKETEILAHLLKGSGLPLTLEQLRPQKVKVNFSNLTTKCFNEPDSEKNINLQRKEGKEYYEIFGATAVKVVEKVTLEGFVDPDFLVDFLQGYRAYLDPIDLLHLFLLRLQWTQELEADLSPQQLQAIQRKVLLSLMFWAEQHASDFQNVEVISKMRFHLNLCARAGMNNVENAGLFDNLLTKFGVSKNKKAQRMSVSVSIGTIKGLDRSDFRPRTALGSNRSSSQNPETPSPVEDGHAVLERSGGSRRMRALSISNRFSLRKDPKEESATPQSLTPQSLTPSSSMVALNTTNAHDISKNSSSQDPHENLESPTALHRRPSRAKSISQKVSRLGHQTKRISRILVSKDEDTKGNALFLLDCRSTIAVQQLCLLEQNLYKKITLKELSELGWTKKKGTESRSVMAIINRFNEFSRWVAFEILRGPTPDERARIIEKFIRICDKCLKENNLSTVMQIDLALQRQEVFGLKKTWSYVGNYEKEVLQNIRVFTAPNRNFKQAREIMEGVQGIPAVPFLGLYLSDLVFLAELPNTLDSVQLINTNKIRNKGTIIRRALKFVSLPSYPYEDDFRVQNKLTLLPFSTDSEIEKLAKERD